MVFSRKSGHCDESGDHGKSSDSGNFGKYGDFGEFNISDLLCDFQEICLFHPTLGYALNWWRHPF